jgi:hypothetical protein
VPRVRVTFYIRNAKKAKQKQKQTNKNKQNKNKQNKQEKEKKEKEKKRKRKSLGRWFPPETRVRILCVHIAYH